MQLCLQGLSSGAGPNEKNVTLQHASLTTGSFASRFVNIQPVATRADERSYKLDDEKEESIAFYLRVWPTSDPEDYAANFEPYVQVRLCNFA